MRKSLRKLVMAVDQTEIIEVGETTEIAETDMTLHQAHHQERKVKVKRPREKEKVEKAQEVAQTHQSHTTEYATNGETEAHAPMEINAVLNILTKTATAKRRSQEMLLQPSEKGYAVTTKQATADLVMIAETAMDLLIDTDQGAGQRAVTLMTKEKGEVHLTPEKIEAPAEIEAEVVQDQEKGAEKAEKVKANTEIAAEAQAMGDRAEADTVEGENQKVEAKVAEKADTEGKDILAHPQQVLTTRSLKKKYTRTKGKRVKRKKKNMKTTKKNMTSKKKKVRKSILRMIHHMKSKLKKTMMRTLRRDGP